MLFFTFHWACATLCTTTRGSARTLSLSQAHCVRKSKPFFPRKNKSLENCPLEFKPKKKSHVFWIKSIKGNYQRLEAKNHSGLWSGCACLLHSDTHIHTHTHARSEHTHTRFSKVPNKVIFNPFSSRIILVFPFIVISWIVCSVYSRLLQCTLTHSEPARVRQTFFSHSRIFFSQFVLVWARTNIISRSQKNISFNHQKSAKFSKKHNIFASRKQQKNSGNCASWFRWNLRRSKMMNNPAELKDDYHLNSSQSAASTTPSNSTSYQNNQAAAAAGTSTTTAATSPASMAAAMFYQQQQAAVAAAGFDAAAAAAAAVAGSGSNPGHHQPLTSPDAPRYPWMSITGEAL